MLLAAIGLNHQTAPVGVRERLAFSADTLVDALQRLKVNMLGGFSVWVNGQPVVQDAAKLTKPGNCFAIWF